MSQGLSLGRIQAGFAQATQEITVAAANLNFDFSLVKLEAPAEYKPIGNILTPSRIREAEVGPIHVTARRLGALFEGACPETPNLIKAYGTRASEISKEVSDSDSGRNHGRDRDWIGNEYGGVDATSIWAAATSSKAALPIHLLACIIARMWSHTEATSVWAEIVAERKREITAKFEEGEHIPTILASAIQQEITRDHLRKWDTSARAWLQTADKARQRQYTQFLLIVNNLSIAVHQGHTLLYSNVINVWNSALTATEGLVSGRPHAVQNGPVLLGLSAWHIFPDMLVFDNPTGSVSVSMNDPLVNPGGVLSLGISDSASKGEQGIYWSLSLSHHRYYGEAVRRTRRLESDGSRLTFNELVLVCIGSLLKAWSVPKQGINNSIRVLEALRLVLPHSQGENPQEDWQTIIEQPLKQFTDGEKGAILAMSLGRRRPEFVPSPTRRKPFFGVLHLPNILQLLKDTEMRIKFLRRLANRVPGLDNSNSIILASNNHQQNGFQFVTVFPHDVTQADSTGNDRNVRQKLFRRWIDVPSYIRLTYRDAIRLARQEFNGLSGPSTVGETKASMTRGLSRPQTDLKLKVAPFHQGEIPMSSWSGYGDRQTSMINDADAEEVEIDAELDSDSDLDSNVAQNEESIRSRGSKHKDGGNCSDSQNTDDGDSNRDLDGPVRRRCESDETQPALPIMSQENRYREANHHRHQAAESTSDAAERKALAEFQELCSQYLAEREHEIPDETIEFQNLMREDPPHWRYDQLSNVIGSRRYVGESFGEFFGEEQGSVKANPASGEYALVYAKGKGESSASLSGIGAAPTATLDDLLWCLEHDLVDPDRLKKHLQEEPAFGLLRVLAAVGEIYREPTSGGATISCSIVDNPFNPPILSMGFGVDDWTHATILLNDTTAMALIGYFETGNNFIEIMRDADQIIGLSGGDSIFVRTAILNDPENNYPDYSFTRLLGNTGKAGFSILTLPPKLMARKLDSTSWRVETKSFNGLPFDSFKQTSLHLSFTGWQMPVANSLPAGQIDADINIIEAVVSVRDAGRWVADVDIYRALSSPRLQISTTRSEGCEHISEGQDEVNHYEEDRDEMISIENWNQVLDQVDGSAVVRCFDNLVARLAVVSALCQHSKANDRPVVVCSKRMCFRCVSGHLNEGHDSTYVF
ncbi:hypothetical protein PFICI_03066 [Pestalotiopsis fici W106-1]|uniref:Uncharacterized protein n=1 Tax=Pestalotiopsis fici (strain W106-1 / CGMCC3.15140) TaxID=1229662 RepID=W3XIG4_PESFW|nr:uncharacterized protein PFICI_03066 [Pestalotiopsis fici W106-1]ETS85041.1 hypothetical protein PFICI_03066 [Pestalotiopsis fici W106-1]